MGLKLILIYNIIYYFGVGDYNNLTNLNSYVFFVNYIYICLLRIHFHIYFYDNHL